MSNERIASARCHDIEAMWQQKKKKEKKKKKERKNSDAPFYNVSAVNDQAYLIQRSGSAILFVIVAYGEYATHVAITSVSCRCLFSHQDCRSHTVLSYSYCARNRLDHRYL